ncbi:MAG: sulfurtransferase [Flavobacteriaceae bacterium]|nr:sulfurtransferase [Flavobacteriaceae bacterium]
MNKNISPIISAKELLKLMKVKNLVIVDVTTKNFDKNEQRFIKEALFINLDLELSNIKKDLSIGGRHPLPTIKQFKNTLNNLGITKKSHVVLYDYVNGASAAARFWWMLKSIGHQKVQVLNGGFQEAVRNGIPISSKAGEPLDISNYKVTKWKWPKVSLQEVEKATVDHKKLIIDVRDSYRYDGISEPIDLIAGHIPNAINVPFSNNNDSNGLFKSPDDLKVFYKNVFGNIKTTEGIVHCGSGVNACQTILAMAYAGLEIPSLYVGSWSEWSRNNKPMVTINSSIE